MLKFLQTKFDLLLVTFIFAGLLIAWLYTRSPELLSLCRDCFLVLTALVGYRRGQADTQATTTTGDVILPIVPAADSQKGETTP